MAPPHFLHHIPLVQVLCVWFNITAQLHQKTEQLGRALVGLGAKLGQNVPWPLLSSTRLVTRAEARPGAAGAEEGGAQEMSTDVPECKKSPVKVRNYS